MSIAIALAENGYLPDGLIRHGIRRLLRQRLRRVDGSDPVDVIRQRTDFVDELRRSPIAIAQECANDQHYEVPPAFFELVLGPHLKYSSCWWEDDTADLAAAEEAMLATSAERAGIVDGMDVLDVGCGWGSLSLYLAVHFPRCRIRAVSNSAPQRAFIEGRCQELGLTNLTVDTADLAHYRPPGQYDRLVSVECLEHMRNYQRLFARFADWLRPNGSMFIHVFCHRLTAYPFETEGSGNWMGRHFFTGGLMPAFDLFDHFDEDLRVDTRWQVDGRHYARTARAWLERLDAQSDQAAAILAPGDQRLGRLRVQRWRMFFMACEELFGYRQGREWFVGHYQLTPVGQAVPS